MRARDRDDDDRASGRTREGEGVPRDVRRHSGLTLLEIMIAAVLITVMVGLAVPDVTAWFGDQRAKGFARAVSDAFQIARAEAIRTGNSHIVAFGQDEPGSTLGAAAPIVVVNDANENCNIDASETVHRVAAEPEVAFGTVSAGTTALSDDPGAATGFIDASDPSDGVPEGTSFTDASLVATAPAGWVLFRPDGMPRLFTPGVGTCTAVGQVGTGGGAVYVSNGRRDYAVMVSPLGATRVHAWGGNAWTL